MQFSTTIREETLMLSIKKQIFNKIQVRKAARMWRDTPGRGGFRPSLRYDVEIDGKLYPPKAIAAFANELAGNGLLKPRDFAGIRWGKWHNEFERLGFAVRPKGNAMEDLGEGIQEYRDDERFLDCPRAFLVTGKPAHDNLNRQLLAKNQSGHWFLREGRAQQGDAIFLLLPSASGPGGYPRELFCGVLSAPPARKSEVGRVLFQVENFHRLAVIDSKIKRFLGGRLPPQGDRVITIWDDGEAIEALRFMPGMTNGNGDDDESYPEGAEKFKLHRSRERNRKVVALAKARRLELTGKLECEACGFDFAKSYGDRGEGFIEAHHRVPIASNEALTHVRTKDFELVCSNCHRMLHRMTPLMTADGLKNHLLNMQKKRRTAHGRNVKTGTRSAG
jgi:hypothetical protein